MENFKRIMTKFGKALWPYLTDADFGFNTKGLYHVKVLFTLAEGKEIKEAIDKVITEQKVLHHKTHPNQTNGFTMAPLPYKIEGDNITFHFKLNASGVRKNDGKSFTQKPLLLDHELNPMDPEVKIYSDSIIRVGFEPHGYNVSGTGIGCTLRLKEVQIKHLVTGGSSKTVFSKVEGGTVENVSEVTNA